MATLGQRGSGTPATGATGVWASATNAVDGAVGSNPATYATWTNSTSGATSTIDISGYDFSALIAGTTLTNISVSLRHFENNTSRITAVTIQPFDGATAIGSPFTCTLATAARNDAATFTPTLAQLKSATFKIRVTVTHGANTQSGIESVDYADVTATYTLPNTNIALGTAVATLAAGTLAPASVASVALPTAVTALGVGAVTTAAAVTLPLWVGFDPATVAGLAARYDASNLASITADGSGLASQWGDGAFPLLQAVAGYRPISGLHTMNGLNTLYFGDGPYSMQPASNPLAAATEGTLIYVARGQRTYDAAFAAPVNGMGFRQDSWYPYSGYRYECFGINGRIEGYGTAHAANDPYYNDPHLVVIRSAADLHYDIWRNGVSELSTTIGAVNFSGTTCIVGYSGFAAHFGDIPEILVYSVAVSPTDRAYLEGGLTYKWLGTGTAPGGPALATLTAVPLGITVGGAASPQSIALPTAVATLAPGTVGITAGGAPAFTAGSNLATGTVLASGNIALPVAVAVLSAGAIGRTVGTASPALTPALALLAGGTFATSTAVTIALPTASAALSAGTLATTGAVSVAVASSAALLSAGTLALTAGAATRTLPTATAVLVAGTLGISGVAPGQNIALPTATAVLSVGALAPTAGGVTRPLSPAAAVLTVGTVALSVATPPITLALPTATAVLVAGALTAVRGGAPQTVALPTVQLVLSPVALNRTVGVTTVALPAATAVLTPGAVATLPGVVALAIIAATVTLAGGAVAVGSYLAVYFIQPGDALLLGLAREAKLDGLVRDATLIPDPRPRDATLVGLAHDAVLAGLARDADLMIRLGG